jgi:hypothetical protein
LLERCALLIDCLKTIIDRRFIVLPEWNDGRLDTDEQPIGSLNHGMRRDHGFLALAPLTPGVDRRSACHLAWS